MPNLPCQYLLYIYFLRMNSDNARYISSSILQIPSPTSCGVNMALYMTIEARVFREKERETLWMKMQTLTLIRQTIFCTILLHSILRYTFFRILIRHTILRRMFRTLCTLQLRWYLPTILQSDTITPP